MYVKEHRTGRDMLLAACDRELLGTVIESDGARIEVSKRFYGGAPVEMEEFKEMLGRSTVGNLMGERVVAAAVEKGFVKEHNIIRLGGVPHAQFVRML